MQSTQNPHEPASKTQEEVTQAFMYDSLFEAVDNGNLAELKLMIQSPLWNLNQQDKYGWTILYQAISYGYMEIITYLVKEAGADLEIKNNGGYTPLAYAVYRCRSKIAGVLVEAGASMDAVRDKCCELKIRIVLAGNLDQVKQWIHHHPDDLTGPDKDGDQPVHWSVRAGRLEILRWLIKDCGIDVNTEGFNGYRPLYYAVSHDHLDVVKWLILAAGADLNPVDSRGYTAICSARGNSLIWLLRRAGCGIILIYCCCCCGISSILIYSYVQINILIHFKHAWRCMLDLNYIQILLVCR